MIGQLREKGYGIVYISHRMEEIFELCDRVTVIKDGTYVDTVKTSDVYGDKLVQMMVWLLYTSWDPLFPQLPDAHGFCHQCVFYADPERAHLVSDLYVCKLYPVLAAHAGDVYKRQVWSLSIKWPNIYQIIGNQFFLSLIHILAELDITRVDKVLELALIL